MLGSLLDVPWLAVPTLALGRGACFLHGKLGSWWECLCDSHIEGGLYPRAGSAVHGKIWKNFIWSLCGVCGWQSTEAGRNQTHSFCPGAP